MSFFKSIMAHLGITKVVATDNKIVAVDEFAESLTADKESHLKTMVETEAVTQLIAENPNVAAISNAVGTLEKQQQAQASNITTQSEKIAALESSIASANAKIAALESAMTNTQKEFGDKIVSLREGALPKPVTEGTPPIQQGVNPPAIDAELAAKINKAFPRYPQIK